MSNEIKLGLIGLIPVIASLIFSFIDRTVLRNNNKVKKQILYGVVFGVLSCLGTEFGVLINGATMNVRDAAPLCAGIIFGPIAGIIAGIIGGVERYFAVYWGAGSFTQIACSLATIMAGIYSALLNKYVFDGKVPEWYYGLAAGLITEVSHMLMVFITHFNEVEKAFNVVKVCTIPMIIANSLTVMLAVLLVRYSFEKKEDKKKKKKSISELFQGRILTVCVIAFAFTTSFSGVVETQLAYKQCSSLLELNIQDVKASVDNASDNNLLSITQKIANEIDAKGEFTTDFLRDLCRTFGVYEINVISKTAQIEYSTNSTFLGFDMTSGEQSSEFMCLFEGETYYVQDYRPTTYDSNLYMKYAGVVLQRGGFVQVGLDADDFASAIDEEAKQACNNRHIGKSGSLIVADENMNVVSDINDSENMTLSDLGFDVDLKKLEQNKRYSATVNGIDVYYEFANAEGYYIIAYMPKEEALSDTQISIYISEFLEVIVFTGIFLMVYFVVKNSIVKNINETNKSLKLITHGKLDTIVDVRTDREFNSLSNGINDTVTKLKEYIKEANERIEAELKYASEIQHSALPSTFPAFPDRDEFDIHATMNAAKQVGGDFYDFYIVEGNKLVMLMADVSGKGIPAALFMMRAKTLIKSYAEYGISPHDVFTNANFNLCEGNEQGLFVTAWIGVLDLLTGNMKFANAGHNPPLIKRKDGYYEYLRSKPGFILGGMEGIVYKEFELDLNEGDEIYLYTDGVTEAQNLNQELYGEDRLQDILNKCEGKSCEEICNIVKADVDKFVGEADQFDDLTMLSFKFIKK